MQARDVDVGSGGCSPKRQAPASPAGGHLPASPVSALSVIASPYARTDAQEAYARDGSEGSSPRDSDAASPFALAEVADACAAVGLRPRQRSRSLLSDRMAEQEVRPLARALTAFSRPRCLRRCRASAWEPKGTTRHAAPLHASEQL